MWRNGKKNFEKRPEVEMGVVMSPTKTHTHTYTVLIHTHKPACTLHPHVRKTVSNLPSKDRGCH